jgi:hypothetical protein
MSSLSGSFDPSPLFTARGVDLATLGAAYLTLLATTALTIAAFVAARQEPWLVTLGAAEATATIVVGLAIAVGTGLLGLSEGRLDLQRLEGSAGRADCAAETPGSVGRNGPRFCAQPRPRHRELAAARPGTRRDARLNSLSRA